MQVEGQSGIAVVHAGEAELFHQGALILAVFAVSSLLLLKTMLNKAV